MKLLRRISLISVLSIFLFPFFSNYTNAQENISIGYAPTSDYLTLEPGEIIESKLTVWNLETETYTYYIHVSGFRQIEDYPGTAIPLTPEEDANDPYSAADWVTVSKSELELVPQKNIDIPYTIKVPENVALGEYHLKIYLSTDKNEDTKGESQITANLGSGPNILIQIGSDEEMTQEAQILEFTTDKFLYEKTPVVFLTTLENSGNTHLTPEGDLIIENVFGQEVERTSFNEGVSLIRGETGTYENTWTASREILTEEGNLAVGPMKARVLMTYKTINPGYSPLEATTTFWIIPWKLILGILGAIILLIIALAVVAKRRGKKKNAKTAK